MNYMVINWLKPPWTKPQGKRKAAKRLTFFVLANICFFHLVWFEKTLLACLMLSTDLNPFGFSPFRWVRSSLPLNRECSKAPSRTPRKPGVPADPWLRSSWGSPPAARRLWSLLPAHCTGTAYPRSSETARACLEIAGLKNEVKEDCVFPRFPNHGDSWGGRVSLRELAVFSSYWWVDGFCFLEYV